MEDDLIEKKARVSHARAIADYIAKRHQILTLFFKDKGGLIRKEKIMLLLAIIIVNFCIQCGVQWFFVTCGENNILATECRSYCVRDFSELECTSPPNATLTGYYFFNSSGLNWDKCRLPIDNRANGPELTYTDACVSACKSSDNSRIQSGWITGLDTKDFVDTRPKCEEVPLDKQRDILCRSLELDCSSIIISLIKIAISVSITVPLSFIMRIFLRLAHKTQDCCENRISFFIGVFIISMIVMGALVVGVYSIIEVVSKKGISPSVIIIEFLISFGISKLLQIPMWGFLYCLFCCKHKKSMEKKRKNKLKMKHSLEVEEHHSSQNSKASK